MISFITVLFISNWLHTVPACSCVEPYPDYTANEYSMELFNEYSRIAFLKVDSLIDTTILLNEQFIYTTLITAIKGDWSSNPVGGICADCPCSGKIDPNFIGDTLVVFYNKGEADEFYLLSCSLWHFLVPDYQKFRREFVYQYTHQQGDSVKTYYSNGNLTAKGILNEAGNPEGYWEYYTFDGKLKSAGNYQNGVKQGRWTEYRFRQEIQPNGRVYFPEIYCEGSYENGLATGIWTWYSLDGKMISTTEK